MSEREGTDVLLVNIQGGGSLAYNFPYENLRLGAIGAALRRSQVTVQYFDSAVNQVPLNEQISTLSASPVVILDTLYRISQALLDSIQTIRIARPAARVMLVGRAAAALRRRPEISGLVDDVFDSSDLTSITTFCSAHLRLAETPLRTDWATITPERPFRALSQQRGVIDVEATKGCMSGCSFCAVDGVVGGPRTRAWSARRVVDVVAEIATLTRELGVNKVQFVDDNLLGAPKSVEWVRAFAEEMRRQGVSIRFSCYARLDRVLDETIDTLVSVGLVQIHAGVESGSGTVLRRLRKGTNPDRLAAMIGRVRRTGVQLVASLIVFEPRITTGELRECLLWIKANALERYFSLSTLIPFEATLAFSELAYQRASPIGASEIGRTIGYRFTDKRVADAFSKALERERRFNEVATARAVDRMMRVRFGQEELLEPPSAAEQTTLRDLEAYRRSQIDSILEDVGDC